MAFLRRYSSVSWLSVAACTKENIKRKRKLHPKTNTMSDSLPACKSIRSRITSVLADTFSAQTLSNLKDLEDPRRITAYKMLEKRLTGSHKITGSEKWQLRLKNNKDKNYKVKMIYNYCIQLKEQNNLVVLTL